MLVPATTWSMEVESIEKHVEQHTGGIWRGKGLRKETSENINEENSRPEGKLNNCISETGQRNKQEEEDDK